MEHIDIAHQAYRNAVGYDVAPEQIFAHYPWLAEVVRLARETAPPPTAPVVDRQPEIDALSARVAELEADLERLKQFHVKECQEHHATKAILFRRESELEAAKNG